MPFCWSSGTPEPPWVADRGYVLERARVALAGTPGQLLDDEGVRAAYLGRGYVEIAAEVEGEGAPR